MRLQIFTNSWRRSELKSGSTMRMKRPCDAGLSPRPEAWIPFSTAFMVDWSKGCTISIRASGAVMVANSFSRMLEP